MDWKRSKAFSFKVFWCVSYEHIISFIGYNVDDFGYKFWDGQNKKVIRSKNVIFNEKVLYKDRDTTWSTSLVQHELVYFEWNDVLESSMADKTS